MESHLWALPWLALAAAVCALIVGLARSQPSPSAPALLPRSCIVFWLLATAALAPVELKIGSVASVDVVGARGLILGSLAGGVMVWLCRRYGSDASRIQPYFSSILLGWVTAVTVLGRLWLSHGEMSGLSAMVVGFGIAVIFLAAAPEALSGRGRGNQPTSGDEQAVAAPSDPVTLRCVAGLLYTATLTGAVLLGFSRCAELDQAYWPDIPLLLAGGLCLAALVGSALRRASSDPAWPAVAVTMLIGLACTWAVSQGVAHRWALLITFGVGLVAFGVIALLAQVGPRSFGQGASLHGSAFSDLALLLGGGVVLLGCAQAFDLLAGYGVALLALAGWYTLADGALEGESPAPLCALGFAGLYLFHRLVLLAPGSSAQLPSQSWELMGIALGVLLPLAVAAWVTVAWTFRSASWAAGLEWLIGLGAGLGLVVYILGPAGAGSVALGLALAAGASGISVSMASRSTLSLASAIVLSAGLLAALPWAEGMPAPARKIRIVVVLMCTCLVAIRALALRLASARKGTER